MGAQRATAIVTVLLGSLALTGCAMDWDKLMSAGFVAPPAPHHRSVVSQRRVTTPESALSRCNQDLYLKSSGSQDDTHALEAKCRAVILGQPY